MIEHSDQPPPHHPPQSRRQAPDAAVIATPGTQIVVTAPKRAPTGEIQRFVDRHRDWVAKRVQALPRARRRLHFRRNHPVSWACRTGWKSAASCAARWRCIQGRTLLPLPARTPAAPGAGLAGGAGEAGALTGSCSGKSRAAGPARCRPSLSATPDPAGAAAARPGRAVVFLAADHGPAGCPNLRRRPRGGASGRR